MAVTSNSVTTFNSSSNAASYTTSYTVPPGNNRVLVARLTARRELDHEMMRVAMTLLEPLEERVATLEADNARLRERVRALESENVSLQAEVNELRGENEELRRMTAKPPRRTKGDAK